MKAILSLLLPLCCIVLLGCSNPYAGGGTDVSNARIAGVVHTDSRLPADSALVQLAPWRYNPVHGDSLEVRRTLTNASGEYCFDHLRPGMYTVEVSGADGMKALASRVRPVAVEAAQTPPITLRKTSTLTIHVGDLFAGDGYVYVPGTTIRKRVMVAAEDSVVVLDSIPSGILPGLSFSSSSDSSITPIIGALAVSPDDSTQILIPEQRHYTTIYLSMEAVSSLITHFPLLIRLSAANFDFADAAPDGRDLQFTDMDGDTLSYSVESWDRTNERAAVWVSLDSVAPGSLDRFVTMTWGGDEDTTRRSDSALFGDAMGFLRVYHFGEYGLRDALGRGASGTDTNTASVDGLIGKSRAINNGGIAFDTLDFGTEFTISLWFQVSDSSAMYPLVANSPVGAQSPGFRFFVNTYKTFDGKLWFETANDTSVYPSVSEASVIRNQPPYRWQHVCAVIRKTRWESHLYVDGREVPVRGAVLPDFPTRSPWCIGRFTDHFVFTKGLVDEVEVSKVARSAAWIAFARTTQRPDQDVVSFERIR